MIVSLGTQNYAKFDLKIHYRLPYTLEVWHYKYSNDDIISGTIISTGKELLKIKTKTRNSQHLTKPF